MTDVYGAPTTEQLTFGPHGSYSPGRITRGQRRRVRELQEQLEEANTAAGDDEDKFDELVVPLICRQIEASLTDADGLADKLIADYNAELIGLANLRWAQERIEDAMVQAGN